MKSHPFYKIQVTMIQALENSATKRKDPVETDKMVAVNAWHRVDCRTREALRRSFLPDLVDSYEVMETGGSSSKDTSENIDRECIDIEITEEEGTNPFIKKKRKKTSKVWDDFTEKVLPNGDKKAICKWCNDRLSLNAGGCTSHLLRHMRGCSSRKVVDNKQTVLSMNSTTNDNTSLLPFKYDEAKVREAAAHMILIHEYPFMHMEHEMFNIFMRTVTPYWQKISRTTAKNDCVSVYEMEKKKLKDLLRTVRRVSVTTDLWKSGQDIQYMVLTGHFIDSNWKLQKRILNFVDVPPPHTGVVISDALYKCLVEWGIENKIATITVDNASYNDTAVRMLKDNFLLKGPLWFSGKIFHVRCTAHIINLLVQDGLKEIQHIILNVRRSVKYLSSSESRLIQFSEICKTLQLPAKKLILDCSTRWNSTYAMLASALEFKEVFPRYKERDSNYDYLPTTEDWIKARNVCQFLEVFNDVTNIISGSEYPTSNLFLTEVWRVKEVLNEKLQDELPYIQTMALKMNEKFNKYWGDCNLLMAIAAVLDPRYKMMLVEYCFSEIYKPEEAAVNVQHIRTALEELYSEYVIVHNQSLSSTSFNSHSSESSVSNNSSKSGFGSGRTRFDSFVKKVDTVQPLKTDLVVYLEESVYICDPEVDSTFDALDWWKGNSLKYRILSKMASDILSIPITTVASESAFSAGGRVIDTYRASLSTETVQVLMCGADWARALRGIKKLPNRESDNFKEFVLP